MSRGFISFMIVAALAWQAAAQAQAPLSAGKLASSSSMDLKPAQTIGSRVADEKAETGADRTSCEGCEVGNYREVDDFFNIREANPDTAKGEWELEQAIAWQTLSDGSDDDVFLWGSLKYGVSDDLYVQLSYLPLNLGDGDEQGNGDLGVTVFNRFIRETETLPAFAVWAEMRIPSGDGSSGVDGRFHFNLTKTFTCKLRGHFEGWVMTANGGRGQYDIDRCHFQWGLGPGLDYSFDDKTIGVVNYLMRSSEEYGEHNQNVLELGMVRELTEAMDIKVAADVGLCGANEDPNFGLKLQWEWTFGGNGCP